MLLLVRTLLSYLGHYADMTACAGGFRVFDADAVTWTEALSRCGAMGMHLAYIEDADENSLLASLLTEPAWIGLVRDGARWTWTSGANATYTAWAEGEPNNYLGTEHCAEIDEGEWNDLACDYDMVDSYVCRP